MKTEVFFKAFSKGIQVSSTAFEFRLFGNDFSIQWYGVIIAFGFLLAVLFGGRMAYKWRMSLDKMIDVLIGGTIGGVLGARLYYAAFHWDSFDHWTDLFKIWEGGLAVYGGLIGGLIGAFIVTRFNKLNFFNLLDLCAMSFLIGQGIGRWGNFTNQEAFGTNTNMPWGMWSAKTADYIMRHQGEFQARGIIARAGDMLDKAYVHPTFLYESLWCLIGFGLLYLICRRWRKFSGQLILCYGVLYGAERFVVEGMRLDSLYIGSSNLRVSQLLSALLALGCLAALVVLLLKFKDRPFIKETKFWEKVVNTKEEPAEERSEETTDEESSEEASISTNKEEDPADEPVA